jgi:hypothetical protein
VRHALIEEGLLMATPFDDDGPPFSPFDDPHESDTSDPTTVSGFRADTYERLKLTEQARRLSVADRRKYDSLRQCLELKKQLETIKLEVAKERRRRAEAERDRAREIRLANRERRKAARDRKRAEETKRQAAQTIRELAEQMREFAGQAQSEHERRVLLELRDQFDVEASELLTCPECGARMGVPEHGSGRLCPMCGHRKGD